MSRPVARLVLGLAIFMLVGRGVGELWLSVIGSADLNAVPEVAVYLGVRYPSDAIVGMLLGAGWAAYVSRCLREPKVQ